VCVCYVGLAEIQLVASNNYLNFFFYRELHRDRCRRRRANNISQNGARRSCFSSFSFVNLALYGFSLRYYRIFYVSRFFFILLFLYFFFLFLGHKRTRRRCWAASCGFSQLREENAASFPCAFQFVYWFSLIAGRTSTTEREREGSAGSVIILLFSWVASRWWADDDSCG